MTLSQKSAIMLFSALICVYASGCSGQTQKQTFTPESSVAETTAAVSAKTKSDELPVLEEPVAAESGDAILAVADGNWHAQYFGKNTDLLAYNAGIAHIDKNGSYTVSVDAGSNGCQYETTGKTGCDFACNSLQYAAVKILDCVKRHPNLSIEVTQIRLDGRPINMTAKCYTCSENGVDMVCNIYHPNETISEGAHTAEGSVTADDEEHAACIVNAETFAEWTKMEVDFRVSGY